MIMMSRRSRGGGEEEEGADDDHDDVDDKAMVVTMLTKSPQSSSPLWGSQCAPSYHNHQHHQHHHESDAYTDAGLEASRSNTTPALKVLALADITAPRLFTKMMPPERAEPTVIKTVS